MCQIETAEKERKREREKEHADQKNQPHKQCLGISFNCEENDPLCSEAACNIAKVGQSVMQRFGKKQVHE